MYVCFMTYRVKLDVILLGNVVSLILFEMFNKRPILNTNFKIYCLTQNKLIRF